MPIILAPGEQRQLNVGLEPIIVPNASLFGYVTDADDGSPIAGALIELLGPYNYSAVTNSSGYYAIANIVPGTYNGQVTANGYIPFAF
jgi:protocatechuate 3,4-dioxygenase beta subunit